MVKPVAFRVGVVVLALVGCGGAPFAADVAGVDVDAGSLARGDDAVDVVRGSPEDVDASADVDAGELEASPDASGDEFPLLDREASADASSSPDVACSRVLECTACAGRCVGTPSYLACCP
jgi:hypothetical protein